MASRLPTIGVAAHEIAAAAKVGAAIAVLVCDGGLGRVRSDVREVGMHGVDHAGVAVLVLIPALGRLGHTGQLAHPAPGKGVALRVGAVQRRFEGRTALGAPGAEIGQWHKVGPTKEGEPQVLRHGRGPWQPQPLLPIGRPPAGVTLL